MKLCTGFGKHDGLEVNDVLMLQQSQQFQLSQNSFTENLIVEVVCANLFDGHEFMIGGSYTFIPCQDDWPSGSSSNYDKSKTHGSR